MTNLPTDTATVIASTQAPPVGAKPDDTRQDKIKRIQGLVEQPEPGDLSTWKLNEIGERLPQDITKEMPHGSSLCLSNRLLAIMGAVPELIALGRVGLVHGPSGAGKSVLLGCIRAACPIRVVHLNLKGRKTDLMLAKEIYAAVTGRQFKSGGQMRGPDPIWRAIVVELTREPALLVVDEVQYVSKDALFALHDLATQCPTRFGVVVAGTTDGLQRFRNDPPLWRRFKWRMPLHKLAGSNMIIQLENWHPLLKQANNRTLLRRIDAAHCKGNWGEWGTFIENHQDLHGRDHALTEDSAKSTLSSRLHVTLT